MAVSIDPATFDLAQHAQHDRRGELRNGERDRRESPEGEALLLAVEAVPPNFSPRGGDEQIGAVRVSELIGFGRSLAALPLISVSNAGLLKNHVLRPCLPRLRACESQSGCGRARTALADPIV